MTNYEPEWLAQAQEGSAEAFSKLVEVYQSPVYNLCYRMLADPYEAEDAAQETFLRAYSNLYRYDRQRSFSTWLLSIAAHYCIDQVRKRRLTILPLDEGEAPYLDPPDSSPGPEAALNVQEQQSRVRILLDVLGPQDRAAVIMRYWYEFSYEEIAQALSLSVSAVKSRLHRARFSLAQSWIEQENEGGLADRRQNEKLRSPAF